MRLRTGILATVVTLLVNFGFTARGEADEVGAISGTVVDAATMQPVTGATVLILGTTQGVATDDQGRFKLDGLIENVYRLSIQSLGHDTYLDSDVRVIRNKVTEVSYTLIPALVPTVGQTVEASPTAVTDQRAPVSKFEYSREEINRSAGAAGDVFRALDALPGVSSSGGEFSSFAVRGGSPKENIILVDNIPMDRTSHFIGGSEEQDAQGGRFSIFAPNLIDKAEFQGGGFSARFGGKYSSLVRLKIREGNLTTPTVNGSIDLLGAELNYLGPSYIHQNTTFMLSARHQDFERILDITGNGGVGDPRFTDVILKTHSHLGPRHTISLLGILAPEKYDRNVEDIYEEEESLTETVLYDIDDEQYIGGVNWTWLTGSRSFVHTTGYYRARRGSQHVGRAYTDSIDGRAPLPEEVATRDRIYSQFKDEDEAGIRASATVVDLSGVTLTMGLDIAQIWLDSRRSLNGIDTGYVFDASDRRDDPDQYYLILDPADYNHSLDTRATQVASYIDGSLTVGSLVLNPGLRVERGAFNNEQYLSPRLSATMALNSQTRLNAAFGRYMQPPELDVIAAAESNRSLRDESSHHYIAGITRALRDDIRVTVEAYYKDFDDLLVRADRTTQTRVNGGEGWAYGADVGLIKRLTGRFFGQVSYSYSQSERNDRDGSGWYPSDFNQPHIATLLGGYQPDKDWTISAKWKYATGRPADAYIVRSDVHNNPELRRYSQEITANNGRRLDDFHTLNIRIDYRRQFGRLALVSYIDILNVYGHLNVNAEEFIPQTGEIEKNGFELIPTLGFKLEL